MKSAAIKGKPRVAFRVDLGDRSEAGDFSTSPIGCRLPEGHQADHNMWCQIFFGAGEQRAIPPAFSIRIVRSGCCASRQVCVRLAADIGPQCQGTIRLERCPRTSSRQPYLKSPLFAFLAFEHPRPKAGERAAPLTVKPKYLTEGRQASVEALDRVRGSCSWTSPSPRSTRSFGGR